jgi:hypothetical protein
LLRDRGEVQVKWHFGKKKVILPKIEHLEVKQHRPMIGKVKAYTIKREGDGAHAK